MNDDRTGSGSSGQVLQPQAWGQNNTQRVPLKHSHTLPYEPTAGNTYWAMKLAEGKRATDMRRAFQPLLQSQNPEATETLTSEETAK